MHLLFYVPNPVSHYTTATKISFPSPQLPPLIIWTMTISCTWQVRPLRQMHNTQCLLTDNMVSLIHHVQETSVLLLERLNGTCSRVLSLSSSLLFIQNFGRWSIIWGLANAMDKYVLKRRSLTWSSRSGGCNVGVENANLGSTSG